ncbi:MAG: hypothetical protein HQ591_04105, partial [candidate division Zixibacteria bacterium]|nr:hypothetical protein [Candidatus Tariuqbacter arcticus]
MEKNPQETEELILKFDLARIFLAEEEEEEANLVVSLKDITERKRAEAAIRERVERFPEVVENTQEWVW